MSARFLFACWPFEGHVFPQMSIARALRDRGRRGRVLHRRDDAGADRARRVHRCFPSSASHEDSWLRVESHASARRAVAGSRCGPATRRSASGSSRRSRIRSPTSRRSWQEWKPDVIVADYSMWGPIVILREAVPIPVVAWSTLMGTRDSRARMRRRWGFGLAPPRTRTARVGASLLTRAQRPRRERRAPSRRPVPRRARPAAARLLGERVRRQSRRSTWSAASPSSTTTAATCRRRVHYVGACVWHPPTPPEADGVARRDPHRSPVGARHRGNVAPPGSLRAARGGRGPRRTAGARDPHDRAASAIPRSSVSRRFRPNVHLARWVSHSELLPRCAGRRDDRRREHDPLGAPGRRAARRRSHDLGQARQRPPRRGGRRRRPAVAAQVHAGSACAPPSSRCSTEPTLPRERAADRRRAGRRAGPAVAADLLQTLAASVGPRRARREQAGVR